MKRSTGSRGRALACIVLVTFAQLLTPGLAQSGPTLSPASAPANAAIGGGATAQLQPGVMPFTQDQLGCFIAASAESTAVQTYFDVSALLGLAAVYGGNATGPGAELLADVMASPDALDLMELPLKNVSDAFEAWVDEAMQACGMPQLTDDSGAELTSEHVTAWLSSMRTTDMLASAGFDMTPTPDDEALASKDFTALLTAAGMPAEARRRLLVWASLKVWTARAGGAMVGVGSNLLANAAGGKAAAVVGAFAAALGAPMLLTYGLGALAGGVVRQLTKKGVQSYAPSVVSKLSDNPKVMDAFVGSMEYGSQFYDTVLEPNGIKNFGDVTRPKLTRLLGKADLMGKAKGLMAQEAKALAEYQWAEANKDNPEVAALLPDLLRKLDAIRRMGAAAADVSRADWKAAAANVIMETMREEGVGAAQVVVDELAAALAPTPGVEPSGLLSAADADTDFDNTSFDESAGASGLPTDIQAGPQADGAPDEPAGEQGGSTPDDSTAGDQGGSTPDDSTAGDQGSDGGAAGDQGGNENDDQGGNETDDSSNPADDGNQAEEGGGGSTEDEGSSSAGDSDFAGTTADDGGADAWGGSTADAGDAGGFTGTTDASF